MWQNITTTDSIAAEFASYLESTDYPLAVKNDSMFGNDRGPCLFDVIEVWLVQAGGIRNFQSFDTYLSFLIQIIANWIAGGMARVSGVPLWPDEIGIARQVSRMDNVSTSDDLMRAGLQHAILLKSNFDSQRARADVELHYLLEQATQRAPRESE